MQCDYWNQHHDFELIISIYNLLIFNVVSFGHKTTNYFYITLNKNLNKTGRIIAWPHFHRARTCVTLIERLIRYVVKNTYRYISQRETFIGVKYIVVDNNCTKYIKNYINFY